MLKQLEESPRLMRLCAWSGPFLVACWVAALVGGGFIPPESPDGSAESIVRFYEDNATLLRISCVVLMITGGLWATWGAILAVLVRRMEKGGHLLTYTTVALVGGGYVFFEFVALFWGVAAFRPGELEPNLTLTLHDLGWFSVLFDWPPFALFNIVLAVAILRDKSVPAVLPRWVAYMSIWCACIFAPAGAIVFTQTGPLAYDGILALYIPLGVFFLWMCGFTVALLQSINRDERRLEREARGTEATLEETRRPEPTRA